MQSSGVAIRRTFSLGQPSPLPFFSRTLSETCHFSCFTQEAFFNSWKVGVQWAVLLKSHAFLLASMKEWLGFESQIG
eukprot:Skav213031  [mRNA]  locus=scaffold2312:373141:378219:+ [translate_table: standard]